MQSENTNVGRKSFVPSLPIARGIIEGELMTALENAPWHALSPGDLRRFRDKPALKIVSETLDPREGESITDVPRDFERRRYAARYLLFATATPPQWVLGPEASEVQL